MLLKAVLPVTAATVVLASSVFATEEQTSASMAAAITGGGRAAVQRNLALMEARGLIREVTGQGRFRMWCIAN